MSEGVAADVTGAGNARVSIVIVNWNTRERLRACLESVRDCVTAEAGSVTVVDNASEDGSAAMVAASFPAVLLLCNETNVGFARAVNRAVQASDAPYVLLLNSDARLSANALESLVTLAETNPDAAAVGAALIDPRGMPSGAAARFPTLWTHLLTVSGVGKRFYGSWYPSMDPRRQHLPRRVEWVGGACMLIRRAAFDDVDGMDEGYFLYAEEMDLCYRLIGRGWEVWHQPLACAEHEGGGSGAPRGFRSGEILYASQIRFFERHYAPLAAAVLKLETYGAILAQQWWRALRRLVSSGRYAQQGLSLRRVVALRRGMTGSELAMRPQGRVSG